MSPPWPIIGEAVNFICSGHCGGHCIFCKCDYASSIFTLHDSYASSKVHWTGHFTNWVFSALRKTLNTPLHIKLCPMYRVGQRQCNILNSYLGLYEFQLQLEKKTLPDWVKNGKKGNSGRVGFMHLVFWTTMSVRCMIWNRVCCFLLLFQVGTWFFGVVKD